MLTIFFAIISIIGIFMAIVVSVAALQNKIKNDLDISEEEDPFYFNDETIV